MSIKHIHQGQWKQIQYVYKCKFKEKSHENVERLRSKTGDGTSNLMKAANKCDATQGISTPSKVSTSGTTAYSEVAHCVIIVLKSATSHWPFNAVHDKYYRMEVELLQPGTVVPHTTTVLRDIKHLYVELSKTVHTYFKVLQVSILSQ